jgi:hypothetical protein
METVPRNNLFTKPITKREYLVVKAIFGGATYLQAKEAVDSTALEHPEWDLNEAKTFDEWENE